MLPKTLWDKILGHMSILSTFQLSRASESKTVTWKPFFIVAASQFTERLKQLCTPIILQKSLFNYFPLIFVREPIKEWNFWFIIALEMKKKRGGGIYFFIFFAQKHLGGGGGNGSGEGLKKSLTDYKAFFLPKIPYWISCYLLHTCCFSGYFFF